MMENKLILFVLVAIGVALWAYVVIRGYRALYNSTNKKRTSQRPCWTGKILLLDRNKLKINLCFKLEPLDRPNRGKHKEMDKETYDTVLEKLYGFAQTVGGMAVSETDITKNNDVEKYLNDVIRRELSGIMFDHGYFIGPDVYYLTIPEKIHWKSN